MVAKIKDTKRYLNLLGSALDNDLNKFKLLYEQNIYSKKEIEAIYTHVFLRKYEDIINYLFSQKPELKMYAIGFSDRFDPESLMYKEWKSFILKNSLEDILLDTSKKIKRKI